MKKDVTGDYIIEYYQLGNSIKVTAICLKTEIESTVIVPAKMQQSQMQEFAIKKLEYVKSKKFSF